MLLAIDPGKTTGWVKGPDVWSGGQITPDEVWTLLTQLMPDDILIVESFLYRSKFKVDLTPVEVIGVIKEYIRQHPGNKVIWQTPSQVKHFYTNDRLKERGRYTPGKQHQNDAMRHILYYMDFGTRKEGVNEV